jgi:hypothetical protein
MCKIKIKTDTLTDGFHNMLVSLFSDKINENAIEHPLDLFSRNQLCEKLSDKKMNLKCFAVGAILI